jgi:mediator of RNA polymerase II transcription subunit 5
VFLLAIAIIFRFDLSIPDLGISRESFMARYLEKSPKLISPEDLTEDDKRQLAIWTKGLHDKDSITDAVLSCCKPQEFYLLAPTLFGYRVLAIASKTCSLDSVKMPLECEFCHFV